MLIFRYNDFEEGVRSTPEKMEQLFRSNNTLVSESAMKKFLILTLFSFCFLTINATHNRAGEITYVQISDLTYRVTVTTFTYTLSRADRPKLTVEWGDNTTSEAYRDSILLLPNYYQKNVYITIHTFPGPGIYKIVVQDPNRNYGIKNIPNSVNVVFSVRTILIVNPAMGRDATDRKSTRLNSSHCFHA
jgi:hypothetical protein